MFSVTVGVANNCMNLSNQDLQYLAILVRIPWIVMDVLDNAGSVLYEIFNEPFGYADPQEWLGRVCPAVAKSGSSPKR